jgi:hypothetical protein
MYCLCVNVYCRRVKTQLQLINISYHNYIIIGICHTSYVDCLLARSGTSLAFIIRKTSVNVRCTIIATDSSRRGACYTERLKRDITSVSM